MAIDVDNEEEEEFVVVEQQKEALVPQKSADLSLDDLLSESNKTEPTEAKVTPISSQ